MRIEVDDLARPAVQALLAEHLANMHELSPSDSVHALDLQQLRAPDITFWTAWDNMELLGCGALKELDSSCAEIKSMRTPADRRRRGAGRAILNHILGVARERRYAQVFLETGTHPRFAAAHALYQSAGFASCGPFASYAEDPNSLFMRLNLVASAA